MTTPVIRAIRKNFPDARIDVLAKPWVIPVFENSPYIDEILLYDAGGAFQVSNGNDLYQALMQLISNENTAGETGKNAFKVFNENKGAVRRTLEVIQEYL